MGGHGGLNILPQKRWNVYNWDNRERVRRDEQEAARQQQEDQQHERAEQAQGRLNELRRNKAKASGGGRREDRDLKLAEKQHEPIKLRRNSKRKADEVQDQQQQQEEPSINQHNLEDLFQAPATADDNPERKHLQQQEQEQEQPKKKPRKEEQAADDERYRLGYSSNGNKQPWYMATSNSLLKPEPEQGSRSHSDKPRRSQQQKQQHGRKSIEELRQERLKREGQEKSKAQQLLSASSSSGKKYHSAYGQSSR